MKKVKMLIALALCLVMVLGLTVTAFADNSYSEYPYGLYDEKYFMLVNHTDVIVRQSAGGSKWPTNGTLYSGYYLTVVRANCDWVNDLYWSQISPDNSVNPTYVNSGYSASYLLN